ncbi:MAG: hypothetical protein AAB270_08425 [Chloroflexota bacterium]
MPFRISLTKGDVQSALTDQGYTATRAGYLDAAISSRAAPGAAMALASPYDARLDAAVSTRANGADWTAARAAYLDAAISSRAAPGAAMALASPYDARLDAAISSRAAPGAAMDLVAAAKAALWNEAIPGTPTAGSFGEEIKRHKDNLTTTRVTNLDRLDAAISSRPSGTDWTAARAGYLDAAISSRAAPGAAMALASPYDARLDAAVSTRASPTDVDTQLGNRGVTTARMAKLDALLDRGINSGSVTAAANTAGLTVSLDTGGGVDRARSVVEVRYTAGAAASFLAEGSDDNTTWYEGDSFSEAAAVTNKLIGYLNTHRYFRFRSPTTGIDLSFEVRALL